MIDDKIDWSMAETFERFVKINASQIQALAARSVWRFGLGITHGPAIIEDVLQEGLLVVWRRWPSDFHESDDESRRKFIAVVLLNTVRNMKRKLSREEPIKSAELSERFSCSGAYPGAESHVRQLVAAEELYRQIEQLTPALQETIELVIAGFDYSDVAKALSISESSARKRIYRAKVELRRHIPPSVLEDLGIYPKGQEGAPA